MFGESLSATSTAGRVAGNRQPFLPLPGIARKRHCDELACGAGLLVDVGEATVMADELNHGLIVHQFTENGGHFELGYRVIRHNDS